MKAILVLNDMPNSCDKCEVRCDGYTAKEYAEKGIKRPTWCPLKPQKDYIPVEWIEKWSEEHDLIDVEKLLVKYIIEDWRNRDESNTCD